METLTQIWERLKEQGYESDKGSVHSYLEVYEKLLALYRNTALNVLEIGVFKGDSLRLWVHYFLKATVYGVDCSLTPVNGMADLRTMIKEGFNIHIFDAENEEEVSRRFKDIKFDVILEDAGHEINQQLNLYRIWSKYLADGGIYIIEDVQDIISDGYKFNELTGVIELIDLRENKGRYDDVLVVIR